MEKICVYCSSSEAIKDEYFEAATQMAEQMAKYRKELVYGGANVGLMRVLAEKVKKNGCKVTGVIPEVIYAKGLAYEQCDELIITKDMRSRKAKMEEISDCFIALPGGFGTLEEISEIITAKQLELHKKPIIFLNTGDFYNNLFKQFEIFYLECFAKNHYRNLYYIASTVNDVFDYLNNYQYSKLQTKWFEVKKENF